MHTSMPLSLNVNSSQCQTGEQQNNIQVSFHNNCHFCFSAKVIPFGILCKGISLQANRRIPIMGSPKDFPFFTIKMVKTFCMYPSPLIGSFYSNSSANTVFFCRHRLIICHKSIVLPKTCHFININNSYLDMLS